MQNVHSRRRVSVIVAVLIFMALSRAHSADPPRIPFPTVIVGTVPGVGEDGPAIAFDPDDDTVAVGVASGKVLFYSLSKRRWLAGRSVTMGSPVEGLTYSRNGELLVGAEKGWYLVGSKGRREALNISRKPDRAGPVTLSPDGKFLIGIVNKPVDDQLDVLPSLVLWSFPNLVKLASVDLGSSTLTPPICTASGIVEIGIGSHVCAFSSPRLKQLWTSPEFASDIDQLQSISPDGQTAISSDHRWNAKTGRKLPDLRGQFNNLFYPPRANLVIAEDGEDAGYYDGESGRCIGELDGSQPIAISADGTLIGCYDYDDGLSVIRFNAHVVQKADYRYWHPTNRAGANTMLADAVNASDLTAVRRALELNADPNSHSDYTNLLASAVECGNVDIFKALVLAGAKLDLRDPKSCKQLLSIAVGINRYRPNHETSMLRYLLGLGIAVDPKDSTPVCSAVDQGDSEAVRLLVDHGCPVNVISSDPSFHETPLVVALKNGNVEAAKQLINFGADPKLVCSGYIPLHWAIFIGKLAAIKLLVDNDPNSVGELRNGLAILREPSLATSNISDELEDINQTIQYLVDRGADLNAIDSSGQTQLAKTIGSLNWAGAKVLLDAGANANVSDDKQTPVLVTAARYMADSNLITLMLKHGADVNAKDKDGHTAVDVCEDPDTKQLLLAQLSRSDRSPRIQ